jgi:tetratricopeptide (TPR) repeat protein
MSLTYSLLQDRFDQPAMWSAYCAAAANARQLNENQKRMALRIADRVRRDGSKDAVFLGRLAWALHRMNEQEKADRLLEQVAALPLPEPVGRKELAGVLAAFGRNREALRLYEGLPLELEDRARLAAIYAAEKDFAAAEVQCRAILQQRPDDRQAIRQLADVLSWKHDYADSLALFERLLKESPGDNELQRRLAEVTLWSGAYDKALTLYQSLLEANFEQPGLWPGYVDAAASAKQLSDAQGKLAARIHDQDAVQQAKSFTFVLRLAWVLHRRKEPEKVTRLLARAGAVAEWTGRAQGAGRCARGSRPQQGSARSL